MPKTAKLARIEGLPVRNLKKPLILRITADDCRRANTRDHTGCAAARAAQRLEGITEARVHVGRIFLKVGKSYWLRGKTPGALRTEIVSFDKGGSFSPGEYKINPLPPSETKKLGKHAGGVDRTSRNSRRGKKIRRGPMHITGIRNNGHREYTYE